jgi:hypothetical protein
MAVVLRLLHEQGASETPSGAEPALATLAVQVHFKRTRRPEKGNGLLSRQERRPVSCGEGII